MCKATIVGARLYKEAVKHRHRCFMCKVEKMTEMLIW